MSDSDNQQFDVYESEEHVAEYAEACGYDQECLEPSARRQLAHRLGRDPDAPGSGVEALAAVLGNGVLRAFPLDPTVPFPPHLAEMLRLLREAVSVSGLRTATMVALRAVYGVLVCGEECATEMQLWGSRAGAAAVATTRDDEALADQLITKLTAHVIRRAAMELGCGDIDAARKVIEQRVEWLRRAPGADSASLTYLANLAARM